MGGTGARPIGDPVPVVRESASSRASRRLNRQFSQLLAQRLDLARCRLQAVDMGRVVMSAGSRPRSLPMVESGRLQAVVHLGRDGQRVVPVLFEAGETAMCSQLFSDEPMSADVVAAAPCRLRWIPRLAIESIIVRDPTLATPLLQFLAQRLREVQAREQVWLARGVRARLLAALRREIAGSPPSSEGGWTLALTHEQLAERAGVSRPKISLALRALERDGVLQRGRGRLFMRPEALSTER